MKVGVTIRNMGEESTAALMSDCALAAERMGFESAWITDHVAIPPDDAEGSGGRYVDPLITLAWLAGITTRIGLGTGVLILPYRSGLPTVRQVSALQELSANRLLLGVGIGWMDAEFRALGVNRADRGRLSDAVLNLLNRCFAEDTVTENGQPFLFKPRPPRPPVLVGGRAPHALRRAATYGDGWLPMGDDLVRLADDIAEYRRMTDDAGRPRGSVTLMTRLPEDGASCRDRLAACADAGVDRVVHAVRYQNLDEYERRLAAVAPMADTSTS